jgi:hypothetical protein
VNAQLGLDWILLIASYKNVLLSTVLQPKTKIAFDTNEFLIKFNKILLHYHLFDIPNV